MYNVFRRNAEILNRQFVDTEQLILIEGVSLFYILFTFYKLTESSYNLFWIYKIIKNNSF